MTKIKRMFETKSDGTKEQFYPISHWSAIEGKAEILNPDNSISLTGLANMQRTIDEANRKMQLLFPFYGKSFTALGDSTTYGTAIDGIVYSWLPYVKDPCSFGQVINKGYSGSRVTKMTGTDKSFVERCSDIMNQSCISIFGGVNDFNYNAPLGSFTDTLETTFFGALKKIVLTLSENNSDAKLFFITPMKTNNVHDTFAKNDLGFTLLDYVNAMKQVADYYSIPVLDLYTHSNISPYIPSQKAKYMNDGTHLKDIGQQRIATQIAAFINQL